MIEEKITTLIAAPISAMGYSLVRVKLLGAKHNPILQIMAERVDDAPMAIEDCEAISRHLSTLFDTTDIMASRYRLEVSSPGIDRPLITRQDFEKNIGQLCSLHLKESSEKGKRIKAIIQKMAEENGRWWLWVALSAPPTATHATHKKQPPTAKNPPPPTEIIKIDFDNIDSAKLVLTDSLMRAAIKKMEQNNHQPAG